LKTF
jgi:adenine-specific DNA-methyltransferase